MEKALATVSMARAKEEDRLRSMAWEEEQLETQMRQQAAQRHDMEKRRNLHQDADSKFNRQLDEIYTKEERAAERLR